MHLAKSEAKLLRDKISDKAYSDEEVIRILTTRSKPQLIATLNHYNNEFGNPINKVKLYAQFLCILCQIILIFLSNMLHLSRIMVLVPSIILVGSRTGSI